MYFSLMSPLGKLNPMLLVADWHQQCVECWRSRRVLAGWCLPLLVGGITPANPIPMTVSHKWRDLDLIVAKKQYSFSWCTTVLNYPFMQSSSNLLLVLRERILLFHDGRSHFRKIFKKAKKFRWRWEEKKRTPLLLFRHFQMPRVLLLPTP